MGRSVRGSTKAWFNLKAKKKAKPETITKKKTLFCYREIRQKSIEAIGYKSYRQYLKSPEWAIIRDACLAKISRCVMCGKRATQVHHLSYDVATLVGNMPHRLVSVCAKCHKRIEFDRRGKKRTVHAANMQLFRMTLRKSGHNKEWARETIKDKIFCLIQKEMKKRGLLLS